MTERVQTDDLVPIVAPAMATLTEMVDAAVELAQSRLPMANSRAMAELANEAEIARTDLPEAVAAAHSYSGLLRFATIDHVRQFVRLFASQPVPVYAHLPVARAALEAASASAWMAEFPIGAEARVQRFLILRVQNALQLRRGPAPEYRQLGRELIDHTRRQCDERGWEHDLNAKRVLRIGGQSLPSTKALIVALFARGRAAPETGRIGATSWWYLSGVSHGILYALTESIDLEVPSEPLLGATVATMYTSSQSVIQHSAVLGLGLEAMIQTQRDLFGWTSPEWEDARKQLAGLVKGVVAGGGAKPDLDETTGPNADAQ